MDARLSVKVGDLVRDTQDGVVGIITREPYYWGTFARGDFITEEPNCVDVWWTTTRRGVPMHLSSLKYGEVEKIS